MHLDHFDLAVLDSCLSGKIIASKKHQKELSKYGGKVIYLEDEEVWVSEGIRFRPTFAMGGIGEQQVAWIIEYEGKKIIHSGDTIWHNQFWRIGQTYGTFEFTFLPINGVLVNFERMGLQRTSIPASLTPEQAFNAAKILKAKYLVPIHYGTFSTDYYMPADTSEAILKTLEKQTEQEFLIFKENANYEI